MQKNANLLYRLLQKRAASTQNIRAHQQAYSQPAARPQGGHDRRFGRAARQAQQLPSIGARTPGS